MTIETDASAIVPKAGEAQAQAAPVAVESGIDFEQAYNSLSEEYKQLETEKENYRKGMLKAKGKIKNEDDSAASEDIESIIDRKVAEKVISQRELDLKARENALIKQAFAKNKELSLALKNRSQQGSSMGVHSEGTVTTNDRMLSPDQISSLKAKGWDDKKIELFKKNLNKNAK